MGKKLEEVREFYAGDVGIVAKIGSLEGRDHFEALGMDERIVLKGNLYNRLGVGGMDGIDQAQDRDT